MVNYFLNLFLIIMKKKILIYCVIIFIGAFAIVALVTIAPLFNKEDDENNSSPSNIFY